MRRLTIRMLAAVLTFLVGLALAASWLSLRTQTIPEAVSQPSARQPLSLTSPAGVAPTPPVAVVPEVVTRAPIRDDPDFSDPLPALQELVRQKAGARRNTFYVSRIYRYNNSSSHAWVYWKEGRAIILWEPLSVGWEKRHLELAWSRRHQRLGIEIVPPERYYTGSNFLMTMAQGQEIIRDCVEGGVKYVVYRSSRGRR